MILITGASGNVGKEVLKQIVAAGAKVRAAFQTVTKAAAAPSGVEIVTMDYNQPQTLQAALKGVERVFLVGPPTPNLPECCKHGGWKLACQDFGGGRSTWPAGGNRDRNSTKVPRHFDLGQHPVLV